MANAAQTIEIIKKIKRRRDEAKQRAISCDSYLRMPGGRIHAIELGEALDPIIFEAMHDLVQDVLAIVEDDSTRR